MKAYPLQPRCRSTVRWWDLDVDARCILPEGHRDDLHTDGLRWFDDHGLQRPTEIACRVPHPGGRPVVTRRAAPA